MRRRPRALSKAAHQGKKGSSTRSLGPAVNPRSVDVALLIFMALSDSERKESRKRLSELERKIVIQGGNLPLKHLSRPAATATNCCRALRFLAVGRSILCMIAGLRGPDRCLSTRCSA
jgi:hypothetical protein